MTIRNGEGKEPTQCRRCNEGGKTTVKPRYRMYQIEGVKGYICPECACEVVRLAETTYSVVDSIFSMMNSEDD